MNEVTLYKPNELIGAIDQIEVSRTAKHLLNYLLQYAQMELHKALKNKEEHGNKFEVSVNQINGLAEFQKHDYERLKKTLITLMQPIVLRDDPKNFKAIVPIYEIRVEYGGNTFRIFCCKDEDAIVVLFHGIQKKSQKTPQKEIKKAEMIKNEYFKSKEGK